MTRHITARLRPGQDLRREIESMVARESIGAGCVLSAVGSLSRLRVRLADGQSLLDREGPFEIVSMTGTLSPDGCHLHLSAAGTDGTVIGGHLKDGCVVRTTVELVLFIADDVRYRRAPDAVTGYDELEVVRLS